VRGFWHCLPQPHLTGTRVASVIKRRKLELSEDGVLNRVRTAQRFGDELARVAECALVREVRGTLPIPAWRLCLTRRGTAGPTHSSPVEDRVYGPCGERGVLVMSWRAEGWWLMDVLEAALRSVAEKCDPGYPGDAA
jgi:hypothetical protein